MSYEYNLTADYTYVDGDYLLYGFTRRPWVIRAYAVLSGSPGFAAANLYHALATNESTIMNVTSGSLVDIVASDVSTVTSRILGSYGLTYERLNSNYNTTLMCTLLNQWYEADIEDDSNDGSDSNLQRRWTATGSVACHSNHGAAALDCYAAASSIPYDGSSGQIYSCWVNNYSSKRSGVVQATATNSKCKRYANLDS
ncbi:hypothetical protein V1511DRAFT_485704 [Dipodascopsis uninucleata]